MFILVSNNLKKPQKKKKKIGCYNERNWLVVVKVFLQAELNRYPGLKLFLDFD